MIETIEWMIVPGVSGMYNAMQFEGPEGEAIIRFCESMYAHSSIVHILANEIGVNINTESFSDDRLPYRKFEPNTISFRL